MLNTNNVYCKMVCVHNSKRGDRKGDTERDRSVPGVGREGRRVRQPNGIRIPYTI